MSDIEWTDLTKNPVAGCSKCSEGCENCYAINVAGRQMSPQHRGLTVLRTYPLLGADGQPVLDSEGKPKTRRGRQNWTGEVRPVPRVLAQRIPKRKDRRTRCFVNSMSDWFHENLIGTEAGRRYIACCFAWMLDQPWVDFQLLTKRPEGLAAWLDWLFESARELSAIYDGPIAPGLIGRFLIDCMWWSDVPELREVARRWLDGGVPVEILETEVSHGRSQITWPPKHVLFGVTTENQRRADERLPIMVDLKSRGLIGKLFVSYEPALGPVDFSRWMPPRLPVDLENVPATWTEFPWPDWVPQKTRDEIADFWSTKWGRGPKAYLQDCVHQNSPPFGAKFEYQWNKDAQPVRGRWVHAWNNMGRLIDDDGVPHVASTPLNGLFDFSSSRRQWQRIDWLICGGESGPGARPMHPGWARFARDQAVAAGVPFLFKQWGEHAPWMTEEWFTYGGEEKRPHTWVSFDGDVGLCWIYDDDGTWSNWTGEPPSVTVVDPETSEVAEMLEVAVMSKIGKGRAGRVLDGRTWDEFPEVSW